MSVGFLSQVEHNQSSPSLASLRRIADALGTSLFTLLASEDQGPFIVRNGFRFSLRWPDRNVSYQLLSPNHHTNRMEAVLTTLEPGVATADDALPHREGEEFTYVMSGRVRLYLGAESHVLEKGDSVYFNASIPHRYANEESVPAELLTIMTPPLC